MFRTGKFIAFALSLSALLNSSCSRLGIRSIEEQSIVVAPITLNNNPYINIANRSAYVLSGTCTAAIRSISVVVVGSATLSATPTCTAGGWTTTMNLNAFSDGNVTATITGTESTSTTTVIRVTLVKDTVAPSSPTSLTGTSPTNDTTPAITVGGVASGNTVGIFSNSGCTNSKGSVVSTGTTAIATSSLIAGDTTYYANQSDAAGNPSPCSTANVAIVLDTTLPTVAITIPSANSYINIANRTAFTIRGTCSENGRLVPVSAVGGATLNTTPTCTAGIWAATMNMDSLTDGVVTVTVTQSDNAGNTSLPGTRTFNKLTTTPSVPTSLTGFSPGSNPNPEVTVGGLTNGNTASLYTDSTCNVLTYKGTATVVGTTALVTSSTISANTTFYANQSDPAGNTSACSTATFTLSLTAGLDPALSSFTSSATLLPNDGLAKATLFAIPRYPSGDTIAGKIVEITVSSANVTLSGFSAACQTPSATCKVATDLGNGVYTVQAVASVAGTYTFTAYVRDLPPITITQTAAVQFDSTQFTTIAANTTITNAAHGGRNLYFTGGTATFDETTVGATFGHLVVNGGTLAHKQTTISTMYSLNINATSLTLQSGSINVNGLGYQTGYSYGASAPSGTLISGTYAGASHGGQGGGGLGTLPGPTYDDYKNPSYPGAGSGMPGGGVVKLNITETCAIHAGTTITANGATGGNGGPAGGSIKLTCGRFSGSAGTSAITANGIAGTYGSGGGGRIALISTGDASSFSDSFTFPIDATTLANFKTKVKAYGPVGPGANGGGGGAGTIFLKHSGLTYGDLIIDNGSPATQFSNDGTTFMPSIAGSVSSLTTSGSNSFNLNVTSTPALSTGYTDLYVGLRLRPNVAYTNGTSANWTDDNLLSVSANSTGGVFTTTAGSAVDVISGASFRSIEVVDHFDLGGKATFQTNGDLYVVSGPIAGGLTNEFNLTSFPIFNGSATSNIILGSIIISDATKAISLQNISIAGDLTLNAGTLIVNNTATIGGNFTIAGGTTTLKTFTVGGNFAMNGGTLNHPASTSATTHTLNGTVSGNFTMNSPAAINVNGLGYPSSYSYGPTAPSTALQSGAYAGASHGGQGGGGLGTLPGATYDNFKDPSFPGAGSGAPGGGVVKLTVTQTCTINSGATITANGTSGSNGGPAGGTVNLKCGGFAGSAGTNAITANGTSGSYGSGGGGRIALVSSGDSATFTGSFAYPSDATSLTSFKTKVRAYGPVGAGATGGGGAAGTIYLKNSALTYGDLIIDNGSPATQYSDDGKTFLLHSTVNSSRIFSRNDSNNVNVTNGGIPFVNMTDVFAGALIHIFPTAGGNPDPSDSSHIAITLTANDDNTFTSTGGLFPAISNNYTYRFTYHLDHLDIGGKAVVDMTGADLLLQSCDLHSTTSTVFDVPTGSKITGHFFASPLCVNSAVTTKTTTVNFSTYYLQ